MNSKRTPFFLFSILLLVSLLLSMLQPMSVIARTVEPPAPGITVEPQVLEEMTANGSASYWIDLFNPEPDIVFRRSRVELSAIDVSGPMVSNQPVSAFPNAEVNLILDDGSAENVIGIGGNQEFIFLNRFTPTPTSFPFLLEEILLFFDRISKVNVGDKIVLVVYENKAGNTDPAIGANLLYSFPTTVQAVNSWSTYTLPEGVLLTGPEDVLIGVIALETPGSDYYPASLDQTTSQGRSWIGWWSTSPPLGTPTLPPDKKWMLIDGYLPGNWMIRGAGSHILVKIYLPFIQKN